MVVVIEAVLAREPFSQKALPRCGTAPGALAAAALLCIRENEDRT